jgi:ABC-type phosphate/phosphonate transport system permease subunit
MIVLKRIAHTVLYLSFIFFPSYLALAHGGEGEPIPDKVPLDKLSGITLWLAQLYNDEKVLFAILVTVTMGIVGLILGVLTDLFLKIFGLDVSKIAHHE